MHPLQLEDAKNLNRQIAAGRWLCRSEYGRCKQSWWVLPKHCAKQISTNLSWYRWAHTMHCIVPISSSQCWMLSVISKWQLSVDSWQ